MLSKSSGTLSKRVPNPSSFIMLEQNTPSFIASAAATTSASIVACAVNPSSPPLKPTEAFARKTTYEDIGLPLSGFFPSLKREIRST